MSLAQISNKLDQIENQFVFSQSLEIDSVPRATKHEGVLRVTIQSLSTWIYQLRKSVGQDDELYKKAEDLRSNLKERMKEVSQVILHSINEEYQTNFILHDVIRENEWYYYQHGILKTIQETGILHDLFQRLLSEIIPSHPKEEYPLARDMRRTFVVHAGPTNSGKTHESLVKLKSCQNGIYLSPLRLLALEVYERLTQEGIPCDLLTGEESVFRPGAKHISCTIEKANYSTVFDVAVIDEGQMISDSQRGYAWSRALLGIRAQEVHVCCSPEAVPLLEKLIKDCGDEVRIIQHERQTPLILEENSFFFPRDVRRGDALIVFSRKKALQVASDLGKLNLSSSVIYGNLPPETRRKQVELFLQGETEVVVSTDAIGMGLNLPIKRIVFLETEKFDGTGKRELTSQEVKQIAGRAGRKGIYDCGYVNSICDKAKIKRKLEMKEKALESAYIAPHDSTILDLPFGSLSERLKAWNFYQVKVPYFQKADISEMLELLGLAKEYEGMLPHEILYNAVTIPFNYQEKDLLSQWFLYLDCLKQNRTFLPKPKKRGHHLSALETYYRAIGLYYSFSTNFGLPHDSRWIRKERRKSSEEIHQLLKNQMRTNLVIMK